MRTDFSPVEVKKALLAHKKEIEEGVGTYVCIMELLQSCDVSEDEDFQKKYKGFYQLRWKAEGKDDEDKKAKRKEWYDSYFSFMQEHKNAKSDKPPTFKRVLRYLCEASGKTRVDASFASKLLHTVNPEKPIWDKNVLNALGLKAPESPLKSKNDKIEKTEEKKEIQIEKSLDTYDCLCCWYDECKGSETAKMMVKAFDEAISGAQISETKKIDWVLWSLGASEEKEKCEKYSGAAAACWITKRRPEQ